MRRPKPKPPIDRQNAEDVKPSAPSAMPTAENQPGCFFQPGPGITTLDVMEIVVMYLLQLSGSAAQVVPGALRVQIMSAERVAQLSPEAQRWMKSVALSNNPGDAAA